jgi:hypothetical protein
VDTYLDAQKDFPPTNIPLEIENGTYQYQKADIFKRIYWYSKVGDHSGNFLPVSVDRVKEIIRANKKGQKLMHLGEEIEQKPAAEQIGFEAGSERDTITRFDDPNRGKKKNRNNRHKNFRQKP